MFLTVCALASAAMAASSIGGGSGGSGGSTTAGTSYTVSDGAYASGGYTDIASPTNLNLTKNGLSGVIAPTGFSVNFFGSAYTSFRVGTNGYILMDSSSSIVGTTPNVTQAPGLILSPAWMALDPTKALYGATATTNPGPGSIGWAFGSGVLEVEWANIPIVGSTGIGVRMKVSIDTATGVIRFSYGKPHANAGGATSSYSHTCCIAGPTATSPQEVIDGVVSGWIGPNGVINSWPYDCYTEFTPKATPSPAMSVSDGAPVSAGQAAAGTSRDFGSLDIAAGQSGALTITITNAASAGANLDINSFGIVGDAGHFVLDTNGTSGSLAPGAGTTFTITFDPFTVGQKSATVSFNHNDPAVSNPFSFEVTGIGTQTATAPLLIVKQGGASGPAIAYNGTLNFGSMDLAATPSSPMTVYIENGGNADLTVDLPAVGGGDFTVSAGAFPATITPGNSTTFTITFAPAAAGTSNDMLTFVHNDTSATSPFAINLTGTATSSNGGAGGSGTPGLGGGGGGGGCVAATGENLFWILLLALGACLGARTAGRRARG